ncbi:hypothetical protein [Glycomyces tenuis]|uniref:hypothetical protein n=1 Tax=Glycomyces tenuis TaxID=58116 RepID=UPI000407BB60|nr:hypothetical protein [Glycomyces tenuis]
MSAAAAGLIEVAVVAGGIVLWLAGALTVMYRGFILPAVKLDDIKFEVAENRGLFFNQEDRDRAPRTEAELREQVAENELRALASSQGESRRYVVWQAWRSDPGFKAEARRRFREYYVPRQAYIALLCGGVWSLAFVLTEPLQEALVPADIEILFPVYVLVAPLWVAVAVMTLLEGAKAAHRRSKQKHF